ncbi:Reticulocyte-binding protein [Dirofilaria immitis]
MKEKEQSSVCVEEEKNGTNTAATISPSASKEIFDDSCFKAPLLLPPRKSVGRRRGSSLRNGQAINVDPNLTPKRSPSPMQPSKDDSLSCSCSQSYIKTLSIKDKIMMMKESIVDDFSLLIFKNLNDLQAFQDEVKAVKAKEEAEEKRRRYEENVRLGLIKKKGRKSKAQLEKERKLERRRLRHEKKEQRRRERRERREREGREGTSIDSEERRLRKERKRERKERREREMRERELAGDEKLDKKERKRKLKDSSITKKPSRQLRRPQSLERLEAISSEGHIEESGSTAITATATWMNDTGVSVCSANVPNIGKQNNAAALTNMLKRPSDLLIDAVEYEKRVKLESNHQEDHKNGLIGIAAKTDISAIMSGSPPHSDTVGAARVNTIVTTVDMSTAADNVGQMAWNGQLPRTTDTRDHTLSTSVETTHPVDPGHDAPSTSMVTGHQQQQQTNVTAVSSMNLPNLSTINSLNDESSGLSVGVLASTGRSELSSVVANATVVTTNTDNRGATGPPSAPPPPTTSLLDPFRQAFFGGSNLAALNAAAAAASAASNGTGSTIGGADFSSLFFPGAPPNAAAAAAFPFLAAQILQQQQQQTQQSMSLAQGTVPPTTLSAAAQPSTSTASMGCIQFPPGTALGSQLASAALLGRTLPTAATQSLPIKTKQGRWCAMHIKIAYEILSKKERRSTPQPSVVAAATAAAVSQSSSSSATPSSQSNNNASTMRVGGVTAPFCPPSTSNANMPSLGSGLPTSFPALAQSGALSSPFTLSFQQLSDPNKLARQSVTPKQSQGRSATTISRSPTTSALHLQLSGGNTGNGAGGLMAPSMAVAAAGGTMPSLQGSLPSALPGVLGSSLPLAPNLPGATASLTNGTSEAAAQAAMFAALQNAQQNAATALPNGSLSSASYLLPSAAAASAQPHHLSSVTSQAQSVYSSQRLFDPNMAAVLQQMQSMEALRQSAAAAQMSSNAASATGPHVSVSGAPQPLPPAPPPSSLDLVRLQMEQQMMDRYMVALSNASGIGSNTSMTPTSNLELMRQQLFAAQMRQQQSQPSLEALLEMQRQQHQQQQQQLYNASRGLPSTYSLTGATNPGGIAGSAAAAAAAAMSSNAAAAAAAAAAAGLPQSLGAAAGLFNSNLMSLGNAAAAANLQQALYSGKNPYSNTLEQLARQKREEDIMQSGR